MRNRVDSYSVMRMSVELDSCTIPEYEVMCRMSHLWLTECFIKELNDTWDTLPESDHLEEEVKAEPLISTQQLAMPTPLRNIFIESPTLKVSSPFGPKTPEGTPGPKTPSGSPGHSPERAYSPEETGLSGVGSVEDAYGPSMNKRARVTCTPLPPPPILPDIVIGESAVEESSFHTTQNKEGELFEEVSIMIFSSFNRIHNSDVSTYTDAS